MNLDYGIALKLALAALLGGCVGIERQKREKPAGLRTNMLICTGSALFMVLSTRLGAIFGVDSTRIAAQIITGIGFLGAGAVLHSHGFVLGLTTAATIWVVAGIGMAVGAGFYGTAVFTTLLSIVTLTLMSYVEERIQSHRVYVYTVIVTNLDAGMAAVKRVLQEFSVTLSGLNFRKSAGDHKLWFNLAISRETNLKIVERLSQSPDVVQVETGSTAHDFIFR